MHHRAHSTAGDVWHVLLAATALCALTAAVVFRRDDLRSTGALENSVADGRLAARSAARETTAARAAGLVEAARAVLPRDPGLAVFLAKRSAALRPGPAAEETLRAGLRAASLERARGADCFAVPRSDAAPSNFWFQTGDLHVLRPDGVFTSFAADGEEFRLLAKKGISGSDVQVLRGTRIRVGPSPQAPAPPTLDASNDRLRASCSPGGNVTLIDANGEVRRFDIAPAPVLAIALSDDGRLAASHGDGVLRVWAATLDALLRCAGNWRELTDAEHERYRELLGE